MTATSEPLLDLARDRRLVTRELHSPNDFYGHATLLKRYAGYAPKHQLKVAIEHGVSLSDKVWGVDLNTAMPRFLCPSPARARLFESLTRDDRRGVPIGPMVAYVDGPGVTPAPVPEGKHVLVFPAHSTARLDVRIDVPGLAEELRRATDEHAWDSVTACVYWKDVLGGTAEEFRREGFECVTAGHMFDPEFLPRLKGLIESASMVVTNRVGSHLFYAVLLGRSVWVAGEAPTSTAATQEILHSDSSTTSARYHATVERLTALFGEFRETLSDEQREVVADIVGREHVRTPEELRELLDEAEILYRRRWRRWRRAARALRQEVRYGVDRATKSV